jgi:hypothetical protein
MGWSERELAKSCADKQRLTNIVFRSFVPSSSPLNMAPRCTITSYVDSSSPLLPSFNHSPAKSATCPNPHLHQVSAQERQSRVPRRSPTRVIDR